MKKKFSIWLNIVTICLCVCAIAIGVYSATTATLKVSGQIGFTAHGVEMTIAGNLSGYVSAANINAPVNGTTETKTLEPVTLTLNDNSGSMDLGEVYFTDLVGSTVPNIVLTLNITNTSKYKVRADIDTSVLNTTRMTVTSRVTEGSIVLEKTNGTAIIEIIFTLVGTDSIAEAINLSTLTAETPVIEFVKHQQGDLYVDNNKLYVDMGEKDGTPVRWYAIGKDGSAIGNVTGKASDLDAGEYVFISEYALGECLFNSAEKAATETGGFYKDSDIQAFVNGTGSGTLDAIYGFSSTEFYNEIDGDVTLPEDLYCLDGQGGEENARYQTALSSQKLWLISYDEYVTYFQPIISGVNHYSESAICYKFGTTDKAGWTTRSAYAYYPDNGQYWEIVSMDADNNNDFSWGGFHYTAWTFFLSPSSNFWVRPAFQLTIA